MTQPTKSLNLLPAGLVADLARIIDDAYRGRETGLVGLLEAAKAVVEEFIEMSGSIEETPRNIQQLERATREVTGERS